MAGPPAACRYLENVRTPRSSPRMAPDCCDDGPLQRGGQNSYLENGHSIRYSDHMSTSCAAAAPTRHPPGEAHAAPRVLPPQTARVAQVAAPSGYLGGAAARGWITSSPIEQPLSPCRPVATRQHDNTTGDAPTPNHPTTSACCRPKRIRRHRATRDNAWRQKAGTPGWRIRLPGRRTRKRQMPLAMSPRSRPIRSTTTLQLQPT